jgi:hypothetical protein|tara:strand:- start:114 stop:305 length:192 start_codon:yes stop_codon:yes gene_type:complete
MLTFNGLSPMRTTSFQSFICSVCAHGAGWCMVKINQANRSTAEKYPSLILMVLLAYLIYVILK